MARRRGGRGGRPAAASAEGGLVAFPTETVYGLGADATNAAAIARLYQAKGRPAFNPLIAHVGDLAAARRIARFDATATALAEAFWPGPLTLVLPKSADCAVADLATAGLDTIAIRVPAHPVALAILRAFGGPVVAPSANLSGHVSPTTAAHVQGDLAGRIDLIVDGGAVAVGVESTIVGCFEQPMLLRPGGLPRESIEARARPRAAGSRPRIPTPTAASRWRRACWRRITRRARTVRLNAETIEPGEALLAFGPAAVPGVEGAAAVMNLSARSNVDEAAANLFGYLRALDLTRRARHRGDADPASRARRSHQRPAAPRRGGTGLSNASNEQEQEQETKMNIVQPAAAPPLSSELIARFRAIVGDKYAVTDAADIAPYVTEERDLFHGRSPLVLRPGSTAEVSAICKLASEHRIALVPQGGNTGLVGGQTPHNGEVVVSMRRMDKIRDIDTASNTMTCEAGVVLQIAQQRAAEVDRLFPLSLGAEGSCTIGGNLSTNAGGTTALAYGVAREMALGLEVVLADGRILNALSKLKKDNTGYDLRNLFIGAEGTLGIITAATLKLFPKPRAVETAFVGLKSPDGGAEAAVDLAERGRRRAHQLRTAGRHRGRFQRAPRHRHPPSAGEQVSLVRADGAVVAARRRPRHAGSDPGQGLRGRHRR